MGGGPLSVAPRTICVYCACAAGIPTRYLDLARDLGARVAARGWALVAGGGRVSMMGAVARGPGLRVLARDVTAALDACGWPCLRLVGQPPGITKPMDRGLRDAA